MVKHSCERCGKGFSQKSHNRGKTPCENNADKLRYFWIKMMKKK